MPGGGKKAVFPPLNLHDHDQVRVSTNDQKKLLQAKGKSFELKDSPEKEKFDSTPKNKNKSQPSGSKCDQQKTPTKSEQKALLKIEQQQMKSEQKAQQKLEKEQQKLEKEHQKEQHRLEKEQHKLEKEQLKLEKEREQKSPSKNCFKIPEKSKASEFFNLTNKETPQLKSQKSIDVSCLKHQKSVESQKLPARKSVDMQYTRDLLETPPDLATFSSSTQLNVKPKAKK